MEVYAPHKGKPRVEKLSFYVQLQDEHDENDKIKILIVEFNVRVWNERGEMETVVEAYGYAGERNQETFELCSQ